MSSTGVGKQYTFGVILLLELAAMAVALSGIYFTGLDLSLWSDSAVKDIGIGLIGALLNFAVVFWWIRSNTFAGETLRNHCRDLFPVFNRYGALQLVVISLAAGVCEELLFRGFLQQWLGLLVASLIFALLHYASFIYFAGTLLMGLALGICYQKTSSLLSVMTWHAVYDLLVVTLLVRFPHLVGVANPD